MEFKTETVGNSKVINGDCFEWLKTLPENTLHAVVTDPPYGVKEYLPEEVAKLRKGRGGIWRLPPTLGGHTRAPLPRFTALNAKERLQIKVFFIEWANLVMKALRPGGHVFVASNAFLSQLMFGAIIEGGLEYRCTLVRLVRTLRGGDRPKNAEVEFEDVSSLPRGCYEPWGIFRKALLPKMKVSDCLREFETGGLRRTPHGLPFSDVIHSERTPQSERALAKHPSLKPQSLLRQLVYASLPLGKGVIADTFMGSGSTIAAAESLKLQSVGVEKDPEYYEIAKQAIPKLAKVRCAARLDPTEDPTPLFSGVVLV